MSEKADAINRLKAEGDLGQKMHIGLVWKIMNECQNSILLKSYQILKFVILVDSFIKKDKIVIVIFVQNSWNLHQTTTPF